MSRPSSRNVMSTSSRDISLPIDDIRSSSRLSPRDIPLPHDSPRSRSMPRSSSRNTFQPVIESPRSLPRASFQSVIESPRSLPKTHSRKISLPYQDLRPKSPQSARRVSSPYADTRLTSRQSSRNISLPFESPRSISTESSRNKSLATTITASSTEGTLLTSRLSSRNISLPLELSTPSSRAADILRSVPIRSDSAWQGNLPCVVGPKSGCTLHNPDHQTIFFDPKLITVPTTEIIKSLFLKRKEEAEEERAAKAEEIWVDIKADDLATLEPLPLIHSSVHYNLAYYHLNSIKKQVSSLSSLHCTGKAGSYPAIQYEIIPNIIRGTFILRYDYTFTLKWKNPPGQGKMYAHEITPLFFAGFNFAICPHMNQRFTSSTWHYQRDTHTVAINYRLKNALKQNIPGTWNNLVNQQPVLMSCCYCFTEFRVSFEVVTEGVKAPEVKVLVRVYKDLGGGTYLADPKWMSGYKGCTSMIRETSDFGRIEKWFEKKEKKKEEESRFST